MKVYDLNNVEHDMQSVDARECCSIMGWTLQPQNVSDNADIPKRGRPAKAE